MKSLFLFISLSLCIITGCSQPTEETRTEQTSEKQEKQAFEKFPAGTVIDKVVLKGDSTQSYSLYLPKTYHITKSYPVIYAFDPHKTGKLPVSRYAELAEKYGYIIIGSNNSENGIQWEQSQAIASAMFSDSRSRINTDANKIYLMGFSGGARIANAITINNGDISGVICCGASGPAVTNAGPRNNYTFFGIAGDADFNYSEMLQYETKELAGRNLKHSLLLYEGKHEWPPSPVMEEAFLWLELNNMRKDPSAKNNSLIKKNLELEKEKLNRLLKEKKNYGAYELSRKVINYYEQLGDLTAFSDCYTRLRESSEITQQLKQNEEDQVAEEKLKQDYINNLQSKNPEWWQKDIAALNKQIKTNKNDKSSAAKKRLLSYLSLVCYMQTSGALKQNELKAAEYFGNLYILVDPENKEAHYLMAVINAKLGTTGPVLKLLKEAVKNGFSDRQRINNEPAFTTVRNSAEFKAIIANIPDAAL